MRTHTWPPQENQSYYFPPLTLILHCFVPPKPSTRRQVRELRCRCCCCRSCSWPTCVRQQQQQQQSPLPHPRAPPSPVSLRRAGAGASPTPGLALANTTVTSSSGCRPCSGLFHVRFRAGSKSGVTFGPRLSSSQSSLSQGAIDVAFRPNRACEWLVSVRSRNPALTPPRQC